MKKLLLIFALVVLSGILNLSAQSLESSSYPGLKLTHDNAQARFWGNGSQKWAIGSSGDASSNFLIYDVANSKARFLINENTGNIGIGSTNPDEMLTVKGAVHAEEVIVDLNVPADYVFEKYYLGESTLKNNYSMPTLEEVEAYTKANHHLPEMPSAKTIQEEGLKVKEMTNLLLQKVEELTLYTIEQEKRIKTLEAELLHAKK